MQFANKLICGSRSPEEREYALALAAGRVLGGDVGVPRIPKLLPIITVLPNQGTDQNQQQQAGGMPPAGMSSQDPNQPRILGPKQRPAALRGSASEARYYAKLFVNGHYVGACQDVGLADDFSTQFKDSFSVQVVRWPESIMLQVRCM